MARRRRLLLDLGISAAPTLSCTHLGVGARRDRFSTIDKWGQPGLREPAHRLQEQLRAMARRGRRLPDLGISAPSGFARILVWARDATDFRPSMNGTGGACASRHTVFESSRERWRDGAGCLPDLRISAPSGFACIWVWARDATNFRPSINGGATVPVAAQKLRACWRAMARRGRRFADFRDSVNSHFNLHPLHALTNATLISAL